VTDADGNFEIKNLPAGEWVFRIWQEKAGYLTQLKIKNAAPDPKARTVTFQIKPGLNDLGTITAPAALFNAK
jgi:hypothetical protein